VVNQKSAQSVSMFSHSTPTSHTDTQTHNPQDKTNRYHDRLKRQSGRESRQRGLSKLWSINCGEWHTQNYAIHRVSKTSHLWLAI